MLHTKILGHRPFGSGEEDFLRFLPYMSAAGLFEQTFVQITTLCYRRHAYIISSPVSLKAQVS